MTNNISPNKWGTTIKAISFTKAGCTRQIVKPRLPNLLPQYTAFFHRIKCGAKLRENNRKGFGIWVRTIESSRKKY